jgi:hypothetical protein
MKTFSKILVLIILVALVTAPVQAQLKSDMPDIEQTTNNGIGLEPAKTPFSLLDFSRIKWSNSYSVAFFSGSGTSGSAGLLNTTMFYEISTKLSMSVNLGILHNTGAIWGDGNSDASLLPSFMLDYHPSDKFSMSVMFQTLRGSFGNYGYNSHFLLDPRNPFYR